MSNAAAILSLLSLLSLLFIAALLGSGLHALLLRKREEAATRPLELVVIARDETAGHLVRLALAHPKGERLPGFSAGQHLLLEVPAGRNGRRVRRAYSLAAWTQAPRRYELGIKREEQGQVSGWIWNHLHVGARISVSPPQGDFMINEKWATPLALIGGGIGITPMRAMVHAALDGGRQVTLFHAARHVDELIYRDEFASLAAKNANFDYLPILSRPDPAWPGKTGRLDARKILDALPTGDNAEIYMCAGTMMMNALQDRFVANGIAPARIHHETFGIAAASAGSGQRIVVEKHNGAQDFVTTGEPTLLTALEAHDLAPASECRAGTCGECRMRLIDGEVRWLMQPEIALADGEILPCICLAAGDLRLQAQMRHE